MSKPFARERKTRRDVHGILSYDLDLKVMVTTAGNRQIPERLKPQIDAAVWETLDELGSRIAKVFKDDETEPADVRLP